MVLGGLGAASAGDDGGRGVGLEGSPRIRGPRGEPASTVGRYTHRTAISDHRLCSGRPGPSTRTSRWPGSGSRRRRSSRPWTRPGGAADGPGARAPRPRAVEVGPRRRPAPPRASRTSSPRSARVPFQNATPARVCATRGSLPAFTARTHAARSAGSVASSAALVESSGGGLQGCLAEGVR